MHIETNKVVSIEYTLKNDEGEILDTSEGSDPLSFIFGIGSIIPGLEKALEGKTGGDEISIRIEPEDGYGEYDEDLLLEVGRDSFDDIETIQPGMQVQGQSEEGHIQVLTVLEVGDENVILDANHPLAGQILNFEVKIVGVRDASAEELDHGHVH